MDNLSTDQSKRMDALDTANKNILAALLSTQADVSRSVADFNQGLQNQTLAVAQLLSSFSLQPDHSDQTLAAPTGEFQAKGPAKKGTWVKNVQDRIQQYVIRKILDDLRFPTIAAREDQIEDAYDTTYQWAFIDEHDDKAPPWSSLTEWLATGSGIYWIKGKAASGKSTLMRYISHHHQTRRLLSQWSGRRDLQIMRFYFWSSGTSEQRSQAGLIRSLLVEAFMQNPDLIKMVFPLRWAKYYSEAVSRAYPKDVAEKEKTKIGRYRDENDDEAESGLEWDEYHWPDGPGIERQAASRSASGDLTLKSLMGYFTTLIEQASIPTKMCFFIDGLDEYDGDHRAIAQLFQRLAVSPHIKVCVSSRPLLPFEDAFKSTPSLRLQDLTARDITFYVTSNFEKNVYFQQFDSEEPDQAKALLMEIVSKADGVFLWVKLVVISLLEGLGNRDDILDLKRRIDLLPRDLETLFSSMLAKIPGFYRRSASELFQMMHCSQEHRAFVMNGTPHISLCLITLALSDEPNLEAAITSDFEEMEFQEITKRCKRMEDRLKVRTMGLLEVPSLGCLEGHIGSAACGTVQYVHRTVRDYLDTAEAKSTLLLETSGSDFNANTSLLSGYVQRLKAKVDLASVVGTILLTGLKHAHYMEAEVAFPETRLVHELGRAKEIFVDTDGERCTLGPAAGPDSIVRILLEGSHRQLYRPFIYLSIEHNLCSHIDDTLRHDKEILNREGLSLEELLHYALRPRDSTRWCPLSTKMIYTILQRGANPNGRCSGFDSSCWNMALSSASKLSRTRNPCSDDLADLSTLADILEAFLERGADAKAIYSFGSEVRTARWIVADIFGDRFPEKAASLDNMLKARGGKLRPTFFRKMKGVEVLAIR